MKTAFICPNDKTGSLFNRAHHLSIRLDILCSGDEQDAEDEDWWDWDNEDIRH